VGISNISVSIEDIDFPEESFEVVISSLALHYIKSFEDVLDRVYKCLSTGGDFVFSVEHPIFTAQGPQDWYYDDKGNILHWPVDHYFTEGIRNAKFLGEEVIKYHRTLTTYLNSLIRKGFEITGVVEPKPEKNMLNTVSGMLDELRRPMMLLVSARKRL
jgi:SAM-dependent methyltransferase